MRLYLSLSKDKIPIIFPLFAKRISGSHSFLVCRYVSNTSDFEAKSKCKTLSPSEPIRLGICRLASGKLQVITSASNQGFQERGSRCWSKSKLTERSDSSLMFASVSKPSSLIVFEDTENCCEEKHESIRSQYMYEHHVCNKPHHATAQQKPIADHDELPLLFLLGKKNYAEALDTIGAASEAGSLHHSTAEQLKQICHHLHLEDAIWAAAKPCEDRVDDIIIRKGNSQSETDKHNYSFFIQETQSVSPEPKVHIDEPSSSATNLSRHETSSCHQGYQVQGTEYEPAPLNIHNSSPILAGHVGSASCPDGALPVLQCTGETEKKIDHTESSDGPSKDQLAYMHLRLSEEMPRFFEQSHDYGLYAGTVHFDNRIMKVSTRGLSAYKATVQSLKYLSTAYLTGSQMEVLRITMETEQHCIQARWRIKGVPLHSYILKPWGKKHKYRYFDAFSTFYVGSDGLIHSHVLDKVMPSSEGKVVAASWAVRLGIMLGLVRPPAFETDIMKAITHMKSLLGK